ncbi:aldehyde dehydrogenase family protein [Hyphomonas hirschiana VP5]|nr:aldehyde dehydrogenase family protein [Hyphomonas hirschiana VP5]
MHAASLSTAGAFAALALEFKKMSDTSPNFPQGRGLYYGGAWHEPKQSGSVEVRSPATDELLCTINVGSAADVRPAVEAAHKGYLEWRDVRPMERARLMKEMGVRIRSNARELALIESMDGGNPISEMMGDVLGTAAMLDYFAGLVTEMKGSSVPYGPEAVSFSVREPYGVVARIAPYNHPLGFSVAKAAAPLAAGNAVVVKPPEQAPLSALRAAELFDGLLPAGVFNVLSGDRDLGAALVSDPGISIVALVGSVPTGKAVMRAAADSLKRVMFELGGKNALIAFPDSDPEKIARAMVAGMNYTWCGQSCGSVSRAFVHEDIYDEVLARMPQYLEKHKPGLPSDPKTTMGALVDRQALDRVTRYIASAHEDGARLIHGGVPPEDPALAKGCFMPPTVFADVTMGMKIAREEIFGPVQAVIKWSDEAEMLRQVNQVEYGLTCAVWTRDVARAHRIISRVEAGFCWINDVARHALGSPFGGYKQSGIGREECLEELLSFTQEKNVWINLNN